MLLVVIVLCVPLASLSALVRAVSLQAEGEDYACLRIYNRELTSTLLVDLIGGSVIVDRRSYPAPRPYYRSDIRDVRSSNDQKVLYVRRKMHDYELRLSASQDAPSRLLQRFKETDNKGSGAFSPDSSRFAWVYGKDAKNYLLLGDADGQNIQRFSLENEPMHVSWSPDGQFIAIYFSTDTMSRLRFWDIENAQLLPEMTFDFFPDHRLQWLPDGHHFLVWEVDEFKDAKRLAIKSATGEQLVNYPIPDTLYGRDLEVSWAPNSQSFAILQANERVAGVFTLTGQAYLTETNEAYYFGAWSADSQRLGLFVERANSEAFDWQTFEVASGTFSLIRENVQPYDGVHTLDILLPATRFFFTLPEDQENFYLADADGRNIQPMGKRPMNRHPWEASLDGRYIYQLISEDRLTLIDLHSQRAYHFLMKGMQLGPVWQDHAERLLFVFQDAPDTYRLEVFTPAAGQMQEKARFKRQTKRLEVRYPSHVARAVVIADDDETLAWTPDFANLARYDTQQHILQIEDAQGEHINTIQLPQLDRPQLFWTVCR
jgi:hypothetical protein